MNASENNLLSQRFTLMDSKQLINNWQILDANVKYLHTIQLHFLSCSHNFPINPKNILQ